MPNSSLHRLKRLRAASHRHLHAIRQRGARERGCRDHRGASIARRVPRRRSQHAVSVVCRRPDSREHALTGLSRDVQPVPPVIRARGPAVFPSQGPRGPPLLVLAAWRSFHRKRRSTAHSSRSTDQSRTCRFRWSREDPSSGALAFGAVRQEREWPEVLRDRLSVVAHVFANALERKRSDLALQHCLRGGHCSSRNGSSSTTSTCVRSSRPTRATTRSSRRARR